MFKLNLDNLKSLIAKKTDGNNKKNIENLVVFLVLLIITIIAINSIWGTDDSNKEEENSNSYKQLVDGTNEEITSTISENSEYNLETRLKNILSNISGARKS